MQSKWKKVGTVSKLIHELSCISDAVELRRQPSSGNLGNSIRDVMVCAPWKVLRRVQISIVLQIVFSRIERREICLL
jgi:hypothetical protein